VRALALRRAAGLAPFTVLSCDNLPANGPLLRGLVLELAEAVDPALARWIAAEARFPAGMVDRIVPAATQDDIDALARETGVLDTAPVLHEPFRQWVIEDDFVPVPGGAARPDLAAVGVELVADVAPFEAMKLRMLNGAHSALAYLGCLAGHVTVAEAVGDPVLSRFLHHLWSVEVAPGLRPPPGTDPAGYARVLHDRFANPAIRYLTEQVASDGSLKLPQRILAPLAENRAAGRPSAGLTLVVAAWIRYLAGRNEAGAPITVRDPLAGRLQGPVAGGATPAAAVDAVLDTGQVVPAALAGDAAFRTDLVAAYAGLCRDGARQAATRVAG